MSSTTNDPQGEYMSKAEANAMDRIRSVAKEAASKVEQMMVAKAMEQAKRKEFETIERNEYDEIMNAQEDADEAKYGEQPKREPLEDLKQYGPEIQYYWNEPSAYMAEYEDGGYVRIEDIQAKIDSGELIVAKQTKRVEDGEWVHVYYPHTGLYSHSWNGSRMEVLPHMVPKIIE